MKPYRFLYASVRVVKRRAKELKNYAPWALRAFESGLNTEEIAERIEAPEATVVLLLQQARRERKGNEETRFIFGLAHG